MKKAQTIKVEFHLVKNDMNDFDREEVSRILNIVPTYSSHPRISKGKMCCNDLEKVNREFQGLTIIQSSESPYNIVIHACWEFEILVQTNSLQLALEKLKSCLCGKEELLERVCSEYNLTKEVIFRIYSKKAMMPELFLSKEDVKYLNHIGVSFGLDLQLE